MIRKSNSTARPVQKSTGREKVVRKVSRKAFSKSEQKFNAQFDECNQLGRETAKLKSFIIAEARIIPPKGKDDLEQRIPLSHTQLIGVKLQLRERKREMKIAQRSLSEAGLRYESYCKRNSLAVQTSVKRFNAKIKLTNQAGRNSDQIQAEVLSFIQNLQSKKDARVSNLKSLAIENGQSFNIALNKLIMSEFKNLETQQMLKVNNVVRTTVYRTIRQHFGWEPKIK